MVKGIAHITGGGLIENVPRMLPNDLSARFNPDAWPVPPIFMQIQEDGGISLDEMYRVFNMGLGMVLRLRYGIARLRCLELVPEALWRWARWLV